MEVFRIKANELEISEQETMRYMGIEHGEADGQVLDAARRAIQSVKEAASPQAVWHSFPLDVHGTKVSFGGVCIESCLLVRFLTCRGTSKSIALFASTLGPRVDSLIRREGARNALLACALQGAGAAAIESFADKTCIHIHKECKDKINTLRYSPGYGDVPLEVQKVFFTLLDCRKIALTLMDTLVMAPEKSVTAFVGILDAQGRSAPPRGMGRV